MMELADKMQETLRRKYFPRVPWTENGPVRRRYRVKTAKEGGDVIDTLCSLARREQFIEPAQRAITGNAAQTYEAFLGKAQDVSCGMIFGRELAAVWSDISVAAPDEEGWQEMIVRSEEGENLTALAHSEGILRFRRAQS